MSWINYQVDYQKIKEDTILTEITNTYILFDVTNIRILAKEYGKKFKEAFDEIIKELVDA